MATRICTRISKTIYINFTLNLKKSSFYWKSMVARGWGQMSLELKFVKVQIVFLFGKKLFFLMDNSFYTFLFVSLKSMFKNAQ